MQDWEKRERHHVEVSKLLKEGGEMDQQGRLRCWHGKKTLERLASIGHSAVGYEQCDCRFRKIPET